MPLVDQAFLWGPKLDGEFKGFATMFSRDFGLYRTAQAGEGGLDVFSSKAKLYILCHGHKHLPLFTADKVSYTAAQLARMLYNDGLHLDQATIELLVCHAGQSVNTFEGAKKLAVIKQKASAVDRDGEAFNKLNEKFKDVAKKGQQPADFTLPNQLIPMAGQLAQALKVQGFTKFLLISYKCPVAQYSQDGFVYLDTSDDKKDKFGNKIAGQWGEKAVDNPALRSVWRVL